MTFKPHSCYYHKLILIIQFIFIIVILLNISSSEVQGYESSVYYGKNIELISLVLIACFNFILISHSILSKNGTFSRAMILSYALSFLMIGFIILIFPIIKGYSFYPMGDGPTYLGRILDMLWTGQIPDNLAYPMMHILGSEISLIANTSAMNVIQFLPLIFSLFSLLLLFAIARICFNNIEKIILIGVIGFFIIVTINPFPNNIASIFLLLIIFLLFLQIRKYTASNSILLILIFISLPLWHPFIAMIVIITLIIIGIIIQIKRKSTNLSNRRISNSLISLPLISAIVLMFWLWVHLWFWNYHVGNVVRWLFIDGFGNLGRFSQVMSLFAEYSINPITTLLAVYSLSLIFIIVALVISSIFLFEFLRKQDNNLGLTIISLLVIFLVVIGALVIFIPTAGGPDRIIYLTGLLTPIFIGIMIFTIINNKRKSTSYIYSIVIILILILIINSSCAIHPSKYSNLPNLQVTSDEIQGTIWLVNNMNHTYQWKCNHERFFRIADMIMGVNYTINNNLDIYEGYKPEDHFGYDKYPSLKYLYNNTYLIIEEYDYYLFLELYTNSDKFWLNDFYQIRNDPFVSQIYMNEEYISYFIE